MPSERTPLSRQEFRAGSSRQTAMSMVDARPLQRNAACHQCRKRKMRCDALRPCTPCLRSHSHLLERAPGVEVPPYPECTYDEVLNAAELDSVHVPNRSYKKLEDRIDELEGLLRNVRIEMQAKKSPAAPPAPVRPEPTEQHLNAAAEAPPALDSSSSHAPYVPLDSSFLDNVPVPDWLADATSTNTSLPDANAFVLSTSDLTNSPYPPLFDYEEYNVTHTGWSPHLPDPAVTRFLIQAFFTFHVYADRLFHGPTFMASLDLHPLDPRFPSVAILHTLVAVGSTFVGRAPSTSRHKAEFPYIMFGGRWHKISSRRFDSFAHEHAKLAFLGIEKFFEQGERLVEAMQSHLILNTFWTTRALWPEAFTTAGVILRSMMPLGLHTCEPFKIPPPAWGEGVGPIIQEVNFLPPLESVAEEEMQRNVFWLAYVTERHNSLMGDYPVTVGDEDISQLLPLRGDQFVAGIKVPMENRQWSTDPSTLLYHPPDQTDSFILYIKATMLLSKVKVFNTRYKARYLRGDPEFMSAKSVGLSLQTLENFDPRDTPAFLALDRLVDSFGVSFPQECSTPIQNGTLDAYLYSALVGAHLAAIFLHDPHADPADPACPSASRILLAARAILSLMHLFNGASHNALVLDNLALLGWYFCGRVLIRFLHAAIESSRVDDILTLHAEIIDIHSTLTRAGEHLRSCRMDAHCQASSSRHAVRNTHLQRRWEIWEYSNSRFRDSPSRLRTYLSLNNLRVCILNSHHTIIGPGQVPSWSDSLSLNCIGSTYVRSGSGASTAFKS
ncbi:hypothetical protein BDW22DRAFT_861866 [Trametopsis cervina]|nr:hypothetical protein BDW22DRAFT_861866 [Trametopsis cervina]